MPTEDRILSAATCEAWMWAQISTKADKSNRFTISHNETNRNYSSSIHLRKFAARRKSCLDTKPPTKLVVLALPLGVGALEVFYAVFVKDPEASGYFVDQVVVVGY